MTTLSASVRLRPTRIGFLVRPDDFAALRQVMQVCTCLWGGVYNPIIPVCAALPEAWRDPPFRELSGRVMVPASPEAWIVTATGFLLSLGPAAMGLETDLGKLHAKGLRPLALGAPASVFITGFSLAFVELID
jgi:hypothetical protein